MVGPLWFRVNGKRLAGRSYIINRRTFIVTLSIPPMDSVELVIASAIFGVLILWFGYYLWRQIRDR